MNDMPKIVQVPKSVTPDTPKTTTQAQPQPLSFRTAPMKPTPKQCQEALTYAKQAIANTSYMGPINETKYPDFATAKSTLFNGAQTQSCGPKPLDDFSDASMKKGLGGVA